MLSVLGPVAQFERDLIRERQREGIALAKQRGAFSGRKKALIPERVEELRARVRNGERNAIKQITGRRGSAAARKDRFYAWIDQNAEYR
jgi:DNA invertase Pin-like site-specific DNA recombinase